jgi:hypothetical protein
MRIIKFTAPQIKDIDPIRVAVTVRKHDVLVEGSKRHPLDGQIQGELLKVGWAIIRERNDCYIVRCANVEAKSLEILGQEIKAAYSMEGDRKDHAQET